jgi:hypothetical protein
MNFDKLIDCIETDYNNWCERANIKYKRDYVYTIELGRKYAKIVKDDGQKSVWGFVQLVDDKKFRKGDILMAAGWQGPARNKARGNVLDETFDMVNWTGPAYL